MNPQDDPEARIRALEPTELGTEQPSSPSYDASYPPAAPQQWPEASQYGQSAYDTSAYGQSAYGQSPHGQSPYDQSPYGQSPYSQSPYGTDPSTSGYPAPYPMAPRSSGSGLRLWMIAVPFVIVFLGIAGAMVAFFVFHQVGSPSVSGDGGSVSTAPAFPDLPELPELPTVITIPDIDIPDIDAPNAPGVPPGPGTTITVTGIGAQRTVACDENILIVSGANNTVEVTGHCTAITVSGFENVVTAEAADKFTVSGFDNEVTYATGEPEIDQSGSGNTITRG